ncbi:MAG: glycosyltransferase [Pseudomonadota bacterium]
MAPRICILLPAHWGSQKGGAEYQAHCLADYIANQTECDVVYLTREAPEETSSYSYPIERFVGPRLLRQLRWGFSPDSVALYNALKSLNPDAIIQIVASAHTGVAAYYAKRFNKLMYWYLASDMDVEATPNLGVRGPARWIDSLLFRYGTKHCTHILAQTAKQNARMQQTMQRAALSVVPNFHPKPDDDIEKNSRFTVTWVANLKPLKQPELFIRLAKDLHHEDIAFHMIGRMHDSDWGREVADDMADAANISYLGELEIDEVNQQFSRSHLFVNTSEYEGFPNTFIQAWMRDVPTLSINVDPDSVIEKNQLGARTGDYAGLVEAVSSYYHNREKLTATAQRARSFSESNYSMQNAEQIVQFVRDHLQQQSSV